MATNEWKRGEQWGEANNVQTKNKNIITEKNKEMRNKRNHRKENMLTINNSVYK